MFVLALWILWIGLICYRAIVLALPFFHEAIGQAPLLNIACGSFSDASSGMIVTLLWLVAARVLPRSMRKGFGVAALLLTCIYVYSLATHIRYVEHFGMNARPYHAVAMENGEMWTVGTMMVLTSIRAWMIIGPMLVALVVGRSWAKNVENRWINRPWSQAGARLGVVVLLAAVFHASVIQLRNRPGMHNELRYSVYVSLYYNYEDFKHVRSTPMPTKEQLAKLRSLLPGPRQFAEGDVGEQYPLWQRSLASPPGGGTGGGLRQGLRDFIAQKAVAEGPWNVVVVLSESLRAHEIQAMGEAPSEYTALSPHLDQLAADGVKFTEVMSSGLRTHFGQTASQCSLNGALDFSILQGAPMTNATCLGDVFAQKGYETYFFYGADNHFDNQDVFYQKHGIRHVEDENDMPKGGPKAGWGYSDAALFKHVESQLKGIKKPFYATVLTLTNHPPLKIPDDVPADLIRADLPDRGKMLQYVDWSVGNFYAALKRDHPRTLLVFIADHGQFWGNEGFYNQIPTFEQLRFIARIPLFIVPIHPDLPAAFKGQAVNALASNVDVAPTLLSLLNWTDLPQQFMGMDAFVRQGPIYIDWFNKLLRIEANADGVRGITQVDAEREELIGTSARYNLLAPSAVGN